MSGGDELCSLPLHAGDDLVGDLLSVDDLRHDPLSPPRFPRAGILTKNKRRNPAIAPFDAVNPKAGE
jgi:hypothetical protein